MSEIYKECYGKLEAIVCVKTGKIEKFEYLIRHNKFTPMELLNTIEKNGELDKLFLYQLEDSIKLSKQHGIKISLNIDNNTLCSDLVIEQLKKYKKNELKNIEFELLENDIDMKKLKEFVTHIETLGVKMNIDDFGSNKQTFERVKDIKEIAGKKLKTIKLDGVLVSRFMDGNEEAVNMVNEIVSYAKDHNIKLVSEFIDTFEKLDKMGNFSDFVQGYLFDSLYTNSNNFKQNLETLENGISEKLNGKLKPQTQKTTRKNK